MTPSRLLIDIQQFLDLCFFMIFDSMQYPEVI